LKYLGIYFDIILSLHKTEHTTEESKLIIYMLGRLAKINWGLGQKSLNIICERALVPQISHGALVQEEAIKNSSGKFRAPKD